MTTLSIRRQAEGASDVVEAAKLREKWNRQLLEEDGLSERRAESLGEGVDLLEDRYPEIMDLAVGEANDFARRRRKASPDAASLEKAAAATGTAVGKGKVKAASPGKGKTPPSSGPPAKQGGGGGRSTRTPRPRAPRARAGKVGRYSRSAYRQTGIPQATSGATSMVLSILGMTVGLSLLYLLLSNAESARPGKSAVAQIANGAARAVQALILPVDPLSRVGKDQSAPSQSATARGSAPTGSVTPTANNNIAGPPAPKPKRRGRADLFAVPNLGN